VFPKGKLTKDHVPPQGVYGSEYRKGKELPWVDACRDCHSGPSPGDELLKMMVGIGPLRTPSAESVKAEVQGTIETRNTFWRKALVEALRRQGDSVPAFFEGHQIGSQFPIDDEMWRPIEATIKRTAVGLLFLHHPEWDSLAHEFSVVYKNDLELGAVSKAMEALAGMRFREIVGEQAFSANWDFAGDGSGTGVMFLNFFGGLSFFVFFKPKGSQLERFKPRTGSEPAS
jgi:hypothetical protein